LNANLQKTETPELTHEEDAAIRNAIYGQPWTTAVPTDGPWQGHEILVVPQKICKIYSEKEKATLELLLTIVKGARPHDSVLAGGFAVSLATTPVAGNTRRRPPDEVDALGKDREKTYRKELTELVAGLIDKVAEAKEKK
jgi:hypothetical protein